MTYIHDLSDFIRKNDHAGIVECVANNGHPKDPDDICRLTREAVEVTRNGRDPHAVNALLESGFRFVAISGWGKNDWPRCALTDIYNFATSAKSRKLEALKLLHTVFFYELPNATRLGNTIIPISSPEMFRLRWLTGLELKINRRELKQEYGIKYKALKLLIPALMIALFQFSQSVLI